MSPFWGIVWIVTTIIGFITMVGMFILMILWFIQLFREW